MHRKCYTHIAEFFTYNVTYKCTLAEKWRVIADLGDNVLLMTRNTHTGVQFAPLYIHSFKLVQPHHLLEAGKFNIRYRDPSLIESTADKLRWYRHQKGMLQREVAAYVGIDRSTYIHYEDGVKELYPAETMRKLAELYDVPVEALLDDYNMFMFNGQGKQVQELRQSMGMSVVQFAEELKVYPSSIRRWEDDSQLMFRSTWERLIKDRVN